MIYDAIVVGARCAGAATALLLARQGRRVLLVDKATFPSDTLSTHFVHASGAARLHRWGLLERIYQSGCPSIPALQYDFGPVTLRGTPPPLDGVNTSLAPRRYVLDQILLDAALEAGVEWREAFTVDGVLTDGNRVVGVRGSHLRGAAVDENCKWLIGADGRHSRVAELVRADLYHQRPPLTCIYYSYWSGVDVKELELYIRERCVLIAFPTHGSLTLVLAIWPVNRFPEVRRAIDREFQHALDLAPVLAERVRAGRQEESYRGTADLPNYFRTACGDGWALVGDAGCHKDPILAQGISDAFRDAELLVSVLGDGAAYSRMRDERARPMYEITCQRATLEPPPQEMFALIQALAGNQSETDRFIGVDAGTVPATEFFAPENVARIIANSGVSTQ